MSGKTGEIRDGFDLIEYPCEYIFKAVGRAEPGFEVSLRRLVADTVGEDRLVKESSMPSRNGRYISLTMVVRIEGRAELEAVYGAMASHPDTVMTL